MGALAHKIPSSFYGPHYNVAIASAYDSLFQFWSSDVASSVGVFISFCRIEMNEHHQYRLSTFAHWPNFDIEIHVLVPFKPLSRRKRPSDDIFRKVNIRCLYQFAIVSHTRFIFAGLHGIELFDNPWTCDCGLRSLKTWLVSQVSRRSIL